MDALLPLFVVGVGLAAMLVAAWPLVLLPRFRPQLDAATGSTLLGLGMTVAVLLASGFFHGSAWADDSPSVEDEPSVAADSSASTSSDPMIATVPETPIIPEGRPEWVESEPIDTGDVHKVAVSSGPYVRNADSARALDKALVDATNQYVSEQLGSDLAARLLRYDAQTIKQRFVKPEHVYHEVITVSVGPMHQQHALLEFSQGFRDELERRWAKLTATSRLGQIGLFSGGAILLLVSIFSYFRLDNATRGYYTGRLQFLMAAAILAIVGAGALVSRWINWL